MKKKIMAIALSIAIISILVVGATLAYFTDTKDAKNVFTVGNVKIELTEPHWVEDAQLLPGREIAKDPTIINTGKNDAYLRVKIEIPQADLQDKIFPILNVVDAKTVIDQNVIKGFVSADWEEIVVSTDDVYNEVTNTRTITLYYNKVLKVADTVKVFDVIKVPTTLNSDSFKDLDDKPTITIYAEAIQAEGFTTIRKAFEAFDSK